MPIAALAGSRLRARRLTLGLKQGEVAEAAGISASYLNLIEHNRRNLSPDILARLAGVLGSDPDGLSGGRTDGLLDDLRTAAAGMPHLGAELERLDDFAGRYPGWAAVTAALQARVGALERAVAALNDRMTHDPHLSQSLHELLSSLSAVRATAAILAETPDLEADWAARFHQNLHHDSERLAAGAEALVGFLDAGQGIEELGIAAPQEEVEDWLRGRNWVVSDSELTAGVWEEIGALASTAARSLATTHLQQMAEDARLLPEAAFTGALRDIGPDPIALADRFDVSPLAVMRRMAAVPGLQAGLVTCDASGTLTFRKPAAGFSLPRFGAACPLWPLYAALGHPMQSHEARVEMAGQVASRHHVIAWAETRRPQGLRGPELREAAMLILPDDREGEAVAIGSSCRVCPRGACPARREPSILEVSG